MKPISERKLRIIRAALDEGASQAEAARRAKVNPSTVSRMLAAEREATRVSHVGSSPKPEPEGHGLEPDPDRDAVLPQDILDVMAAKDLGAPEEAFGDFEEGLTVGDVLTIQRPGDLRPNREVIERRIIVPAPHGEFPVGPVEQPRNPSLWAPWVWDQEPVGPKVVVDKKPPDARNPFDPRHDEQPVLTVMQP